MPKSFRDRFYEIKDEIREMDPKEVAEFLESPENGEPVLIDVREREEYEDGTIPGSQFIPRGFLDLQIEKEVPERDTPIVLYCAGGVRSAMAAHDLQEMDYENVISMAGGYNRWEEHGLPTVKPESMTPEQRDRYSRHTKIPEIGEEGQQKLLRSKVLLVGAGGLGSPAGYYLAAAGIGTLGIVDDDVVERSNLQRQILHTDEDVGEPKVDSAERRINQLNPDVEVEKHKLRLNDDNVRDIIAGYDVIVDGVDNFPTRYTINEAAMELGIPTVHGSIFRFEGQVTTFLPDSGPCYKCLFPEPTPDEMAPGWDEAGTLGVLPGIVGTIQATEVVKILLGLGETLSGRLLTFDTLSMSFRPLKIFRDPDCPIEHGGETASEEQAQKQTVAAG